MPDVTGKFRGIVIPSVPWHAFDYVWAWKGHDTLRQRSCLRRKGQRCRVLVRGAMNSALIEFEDGFRTVASRNGLRRA